MATLGDVLNEQGYMLPTACTDSLAALSFSMSTIRPCMVLYILFLGALATMLLNSYIIIYHLKNSR